MSMETKKPIQRRQLLRGVAAVTALAAMQTPNLARASEAAAPALVGVWLSHVTDQTGSTRIDIMSFSADGLVLTGGALPVVAPKLPESGRSTIGQGTWMRAMGGGYVAQFVELNAGADGAFSGSTTISTHFTLSADGNSVSGRFNIVIEAGGHVVFTSHGTARATRITPTGM